MSGIVDALIRCRLRLWGPRADKSAPTRDHQFGAWTASSGMRTNLARHVLPTSGGAGISLAWL
jgi:hypothetical protein